jgi:hypothetical protein
MMKHWMFSCKDVSKKVSASMDRTLPFYQRMFIRIHLMMCKYCSRFRRQLMILRKMSRIEIIFPKDVDQSMVLSMEARERLKKSLRSFL